MERQTTGVPEAVPRALRVLEGRLGVHAMDRLWIFPPLVQGRRERGLIAVSCFATAEDRRRVITASYHAERTGRGTTFEPVLLEEGSAPPDAIPRIMDGVVRRTEVELGDPREVAIDGDEDAFRALLAEFDALLEAADP